MVNGGKIIAYKLLFLYVQDWDFYVIWGILAQDIGNLRKRERSADDDDDANDVINSC